MDTGLMVSLDICRIICDSVSDPEVNQLQLSFHENEIGGLQVRMDDLLVVYHLDSLQDLIGSVKNIYVLPGKYQPVASSTLSKPYSSVPSDDLAVISRSLARVSVDI